MLRMKIHESGGFAQFPSRTVFAKGLIILCTGALPSSLASTALFSIMHFEFVAHLCSFVQVWSEGLRYCKQPKETKGSVLEKFQSHQHNLGRGP